MSDRRIDALSTPRSIWLISPDGLPQAVPVDEHTSNGLLVPFTESQGRPMLLPSASDDGWKVLEKECTASEYAAWMAIDAESKRPGGPGHAAWKKLTRDMLPACLLEGYKDHPKLGELAAASVAAPKPAAKAPARAQAQDGI